MSFRYHKFPAIQYALDEEEDEDVYYKFKMSELVIHDVNKGSLMRSDVFKVDVSLE